MDEQPLGVVPLSGRGSLPFALVHGESLVAAASWALGAAGVDLVDLGTAFEQVQAEGRPLVLHDPLCPLTPVGFLEEAIAESEASGAVVVGVRPVTDTVKEHAEGRLGATVDREDLVCVTSPVVLPAAVLASLTGVDADDLALLVDQLAGRFPVRYLQAPPLGRRVVSEDDVAVLAALSESAAGGPGPG